MPVADPGRREVGDDGVTVAADGDRVLVEDVGPTGGVTGVPIGQIGEGRVVASGDRLTTGRVALELVELAETDRGRQVGQPEVVAEHLVAVALAHALVAIEPDPVGQPVVVGRDEAALAGRHVLGRVQAERAVAEAPDPAPADRRAMRLAGVLDDRKTVTVGDLHDRGHVGRQAEQVDRADRARARRDRGLDPVGVDDVGVGLDVDEDGRRPVNRIELTVALKVCATVMTSSPGPSPRPSNRHISATVPLLTAIACFDPMNAANRSSSSATRRPPASIPLSRTSVTAAISSGPMSGRAIGITRLLLAGRLAPDGRPASHRPVHSHARIAGQSNAGESDASTSTRRSPQAQTQPIWRAGLPTTSA